jgi:hypothetical protein
MHEPTVRFPVTCPKCRTERLTEIPIDVVADALQRGADICLVATCHDVIWTATELELEQIDEYLGAVLSVEFGREQYESSDGSSGERLVCL